LAASLKANNADYLSQEYCGVSLKKWLIGNIVPTGKFIAKL